MAEGGSAEILAYASAVPGSRFHRRAGVMLLIWSGVLLLAGMPPALVAFVGLGLVLHGEFCLAVMVVLVPGVLGFSLIRGGIRVLRLGLVLVDRRVIGVERTIDMTWRFEGAMYLVAGGTLAVSFLGSIQVVVILTMPALGLAVALTYTRKLLRRVAWEQARRKEG